MPEHVAPLWGAEGGTVVLSDVVERAHGIHIEVWRLALGQLDASDAQRPHVHLALVLALVHGQYDLGRHPVGRANEAVGGTGDAGGTKVGQLDAALVSQQNVARLDVSAWIRKIPLLTLVVKAEMFRNNEPVDTILTMKIGQSRQATSADGRDLLLQQWRLVHFDDVRG